MGSESKESWFLDIVEKLDDFCKRVDGKFQCKLTASCKDSIPHISHISFQIITEKIEKEQQQMKACKKKTELETKLAQEVKLHVSSINFHIRSEYS